MAVTKEYQGFMLFVFENGKIAKVEMSAYATKTNRKKLVGAYSDKAPLAAALYLPEDGEVLLTSSAGRMLLLHTGAIQSKSSRTTQGVAAMTLKRGQKVVRVQPYEEGMLQKPDRYRKALPALGAMPAPEDTQGEQMKLE